MLDLGTQLRDYLDETASAVELEDILATPTGDGPVRPLVARTPSRPLTSWAYGAAAVVITLLLVGGAAWLLRGEPAADPTDRTTVSTTAVPSTVSPRSVIEDHFAAFNAHDLDAMMAFYSEDSVITGHPSEAVQTDLDTIRRVISVDMLVAAGSNAYLIRNLQVSGDTVTWDHMWTNNQGAIACMEGNSAVVRNGIIISWSWPELDPKC